MPTQRKRKATTAAVPEKATAGYKSWRIVKAINAIEHAYIFAISALVILGIVGYALFETQGAGWGLPLLIVFTGILSLLLIAWSPKNPIYQAHYFLGLATIIGGFVGAVPKWEFAKTKASANEFGLTCTNHFASELCLLVLLLGVVLVAVAFVLDRSKITIRNDGPAGGNT